METIINQNQDHHHRKTNVEPQKCPRCDSTNTKFCYYNNYSISQPRYFCKSCRRYWTHGGTLRNVPVGGGSRKGKRSKTTSTSSSPSPSPSPSSLVSSSSSAAASSSSSLSQLPPLSVVPSSDPSFAAACLSSFGEIQTSFSLPQPFTQGLMGSSSSGSSSPAMSLLQGFGDISNSFRSAHQDQFYVSPNLSGREGLMGQFGGTVRPSHRPFSSSSLQDQWQLQSFNNIISPGNSETIWNSSTSGPSLRPNQWPDLPRSYGSPPP